MTSAQLDHGPSMATSETTVGGAGGAGGAGADSGGEKSLLTSPEESVFEKSSPEAASIHSDTANLAENEGEAEKDGDKKLRTLDSNDPDAEPVYPKMLTKVLVGVGLALAVFLVSLDQTIVATAIPQISDHFKALNDVGWYASAFFLTTTALQPTFGKLYKVFNVKYVFLTAISIFEIGSLICAVAPTSVALIVGRAIAGVGGAGIFSGAFTIISYVVPLRQRPMFFAAVGAVNAVASVAGPLAGGAFTEHVSWRWCFYINLPIGAITIATIAFLLPVPKQRLLSLPLREKFSELDLWGLFFLIPSIVCLLLALQWGGTVHAWNSSIIIGLFVGFGLMVLIFVGIQIYRGDRATLPLSVLKQRTIASAAFFMFFMGASIFILIYYIPIYFQAIKGSTPTDSGLQLLPLMLSLVVLSFIIGGIVQWWGQYAIFIIIGSAIFTIGAGLLTLSTVDQPDWRMYGFTIVAGAGCGICLQNGYLSVQAVLPQSSLPIGNAIVMFSQTLSGAIFLAISNSVLSNGLVNEISKRIPNIDPNTIIMAGATGIRTIVTEAQLPLVLEAYNSAVRDVFIMAIATGGCAFLASLGFEWKSIKGKNLAEGMA